MTSKVYVSGPMTGYIDFNREAFHRATAHLRARGFEVVDPTELDITDPPPPDVADGTAAAHAWYMRRDIRELLDCDAIYMLPGWRYSKGAGIEHQVARAIGLLELHETDLELWRTFEGEPEVQDGTPPDFEAESPDDEPLAEWERELLNQARFNDECPLDRGSCEENGCDGECEKADGSADYANGGYIPPGYATRPPGGYSDCPPPVPYAVGDKVMVNNPKCDPAWNGPGTVVAVNDPTNPVLTLPMFPVAVRPLAGRFSDDVGGFRLEHLSPYPSKSPVDLSEGTFYVAPAGTPVEEFAEKGQEIAGTVTDLADHPRFGSVFEGYAEKAHHAPFADIEIEVDNSLPENTLRFETPAGRIDFEVTWVNGHPYLEPRDLRTPRRGDEFPNVGYVRHMLGLIQASEEDGERRSA